MQLQQKDFARAPRDLLPIPLKGITNQSLLYSGIKERDTKNPQPNLLAFSSLLSDIPLKWTGTCPCIVQT
jgi:hypothetical protein